MNRSELTSQIADRTGLSRHECELVLEAAFSTISAALEQGERVTLTGFGSFEVRSRAARSVHSPGDGSLIDIPASRCAAFRPCQALKERVAADSGSR